MKNSKKKLIGFSRSEKKIDLFITYNFPETIKTIMRSKKLDESKTDLSPLFQLISNLNENRDLDNYVLKIFSRIKNYENSQFNKILVRWNTFVRNMGSKNSPTKTHTNHILKKLKSSAHSLEKVSDLHEKNHYCLSDDDFRILNNCLSEIHKIESRISTTDNLKKNNNFKFDTDEANLHSLYTSLFSSFNLALISPISKIKIEICKLILLTVDKHTESKNIERVISKYNKKHSEIKNIDRKISKGRPKIS